MADSVKYRATGEKRKGHQNVYGAPDPRVGIRAGFPEEVT